MAKSTGLSVGLRLIGTLPRVPLLVAPTPVHRLNGLSRMLGLEVFAKRDDIESYGIAGSKARKLEMILGHAKTIDAKTLITMGPPESNTCRALAFAAAQNGVAAHLVISSDEPSQLSGNLLLSVLAGATVHWVGPMGHSDLQACLESVAQDLGRTDPHALMVPAGCSSPLGAIGMVRAYIELTEQMRSFGGVGTIVHASATGGIWAGLAAGAVLEDRPLPIAVNVASLFANIYAEYGALLGRVLEFFGVQFDLSKLTVEDWIVDRPSFRAYGEISGDDLRVIRELVHSDGVLLDPIYSAKALRAIVDLRSSGRLIEPVILWHSGGVQNYSDLRLQQYLSAFLKPGISSGLAL